MPIEQTPHCDQRVLHKKGECQYCDKFEGWQELRELWGVNFTGHHETKDERGHPILPCPSEVTRPLSDIDKWDGNVPFKNNKINEDAPMFEGKAILHDPLSRQVYLANSQSPNPNCDMCHGTGEIDSGGNMPWDASINVRCECTYANPTEHE